jgi:TPR repeat protein
MSHPDPPLAEQGDAKAQTALGALYLMGNGVSKSPSTAMKWLNLAVEQGHPGGQGLLGLKYYQSGDLVRSYMWNSFVASKNANAIVETLKRTMSPPKSKPLSASPVSASRRTIRGAETSPPLKTRPWSPFKIF